MQFPVSCFRFQKLETRNWKPETVLVGLGRVELPTSPLSGVRSSHLSYRPMLVASARHLVYKLLMTTRGRRQRPSSSIGRREVGCKHYPDFQHNYCPHKSRAAV